MGAMIPDSGWITKPPPGLGPARVDQCPVWRVIMAPALVWVSVKALLA